MRRLLLTALAVVPAMSCPSAEPYREPHRPQLHFTPARNWMNDPNGMVFHDGEYHLFYQYNPHGDRWGHMSWGHAVSRDLVRWEHLAPALLEEDGVMIFSGSAVVDRENTSGFGRDGKVPLVAIYTGHHTGSNTGRALQDQRIAWSLDRGRTWTKHPGAVLDIGQKDFRDPKVMWHEPARRWVMTVALPVERKVRFYASPDLKAWTQTGEFGPAGAVKGIWECPDLFPVPVEGAVEGGGDSRWVLIVNIGSHAVAGGSGCQYFVGRFDGKSFTADPIPPLPSGSAAFAAAERASWVDFAKDFYAAVSWSDVPASDGRRLWLGWMSNWQYANDVPTSPWRSAMSLPRSLTLRRADERWLLVQEPVRELETLRAGRESLRLEETKGRADLSRLDAASAELFELEAELEPTADARFELRLRTGPEAETALRVDVARGELVLDRTRSGEVRFHKEFPAAFPAPIRLREGKLRLRIFADTSSVEVFVNGGETVLTSLVLPPPGPRRLELEVQQGALRRAELTVWMLKSAWRR